MIIVSLGSGQEKGEDCLPESHKQAVISDQRPTVAI